MSLLGSVARRGVALTDSCHTGGGREGGSDGVGTQGKGRGVSEHRLCLIHPLGWYLRPQGLPRPHLARLGWLIVLSFACTRPIWLPQETAA